MSHQWSEGPEAFLRMKASEQHIQTLPDISEEYFTLLPGDEKTRIVCGRFVASVRLDTNFLCRFFIRVTMVWRKSGNDFKLLHLHNSNARDSLSSFESPQGTSSMCQYIGSLCENRPFPPKIREFRQQSDLPEGRIRAFSLSEYFRDFISQSLQPVVLCSHRIRAFSDLWELIRL